MAQNKATDELDGVVEALLDDFESTDERAGSRVGELAKIMVDADEAKDLLDVLESDSRVSIENTRNADKIDTLGRPVSVYFEVKSDESKPEEYGGGESEHETVEADDAMAEVDESNTKMLADIRDAHEVEYEDENLVVFIDMDGVELHETADLHDVTQENLLAHMRELTPAHVDAHWNAATPFVVKKDRR